MNLNSGFEKGHLCAGSGAQKVRSPRVYVATQREYCVCVCSVLYLPLSNQMMIEIIRSPCLLIMFTFSLTATNPVFWGEHRLASDHRAADVICLGLLAGTG